MSCTEARMEVLLAAAGRAAAVVMIDGVLIGEGVPAAAAVLEGCKGAGAAVVDTDEGTVACAGSRYEVRVR